MMEMSNTIASTVSCVCNCKKDPCEIYHLIWTLKPQAPTGLEREVRWAPYGKARMDSTFRSSLSRFPPFLCLTSGGNDCFRCACGAGGRG